MRRQKRNAVWGLAVIMMVMVSLSGCGGNTDTSQAPAPAKSQGQGETAVQTQPGAQTEVAGEPMTLTYWHHGASEDIVTPLRKVTVGFEAESLDTKIDSLALPTDSFYQKYVTVVAINTASDIFDVRGMELLALVNQNAIVPLNDYLDQWDEKDKIAQSIWSSVSSHTKDGKACMVSGCMDVCITWYNMKKMRETGVEIPTTIGEFLKGCETYAKPEENNYLYSLRDGVGSYDNSFIFLMSYAGADGFLDESGNCILDQDIFVEATDNYARTYKNGWVSRDSVTSSYKKMVAEFGSGISMSMSHNSTLVTNHKRNLGEGNFANAIYPAGESGETVIPAPSTAGVAVMTQSGHPAEAAKSVECLGAHSAASYFCQVVGKIPVSDLVYGDQWCKEDPYMGKYSEIMNSDSVILYNNPIWLTEWASFTGQDIVLDFQAVPMGDKESKEVLNSWAEKLTSYQQEYLKGRQ